MANAQLALNGRQQRREKNPGHEIDQKNKHEEKDWAKLMPKGIGPNTQQSIRCRGGAFLRRRLWYIFALHG
jgi:hypothetical protein